VVVRVLYRGFYVDGLRKTTKKKASLKDYRCTVLDSNLKTTGCRYRINAINLRAVYISSCCRLVGLFRSALSFCFKSEIRMQNTSGVEVREAECGKAGRKCVLLETGSGVELL